MQVGTNKDQGLYNKPSAAVYPGALTEGTLPQYNTMGNVQTPNGKRTSAPCGNTYTHTHNSCEGVYFKYTLHFVHFPSLASLYQLKPVETVIYDKCVS